MLLSKIKSHKCTYKNYGKVHSVGPITILMVSESDWPSARVWEDVVGGELVAAWGGGCWRLTGVDGGWRAGGGCCTADVSWTGICWDEVG